MTAPWTRFLRWLALASLVFGGGLYTFILMVDPYQNVPFSPAFDRAPISTNQRYAFPALARNPGFDSVIIGTSTLRLIDPARMSRLLDSPFVNLAMNSATAYEQTRIHALFMRARADYLVIGIDDAWCERQAEYTKYTFRGFPEWMYDDDPWNDLRYMFNDQALENAVRMVEYLTGKREAKYRRDGYRDLSKDFGTYDLEAARGRLYEGRCPPYPSGLARAPSDARRLALRDARAPRGHAACHADGNPHRGGVPAAARILGQQGRGELR